MNEVNSNEDAKAKLTYSQITDSFVFTSSETGRNAVVTVGNKDGANAFGGADSFFGVAEGEARGSDATIVIDGETISQSSNTFTLDGIQFTLKADFDAENNRDNLGPATFTVEQDIDQVVEKVTQFVSEYNKLTQELYALTIEEMDYDYSPLTQDEKADLSQEDIEKWETEAKKGILRNDNTIKNLLSKLRSNFFSVVEGSGLSAYDIGFNTSKYSQGQYGGQITFDEDKFREMLQKDPDAVAKVMAGTSDAVDDLTEYQESGLVSRLFDQMSDFKSTIQGKNLKNTNQQIDDTNDSMNDLIAKMYEEQERLYIQYAQMETLLSQYQSQSTWLAQQLSAL
nr:flagellar filament capping protein FliD [Christensenella tenuis]